MPRKGCKRKKTPGVPYIKVEKGFPYYYVTVSPGKRKTLHRLTWELNNGPIPNGMIISFKDGNTLNCEIENLECISRGERGIRNQRPEKQRATMAEKVKTQDWKDIVARRQATMKRLWQEGKFPIEERSKKISEMIKNGEMRNPIVNLADHMVSYYLFPKNKELRTEVLNHPELIELKRKQIQLNRAIKNHEKSA